MEDDIEIQGEDAIASPAKRGRKPKSWAPTVEIEAEDEPAVEIPAVRMLPVKLMRNYRPSGPFTIDGLAPSKEQLEKVFAGAEIMLEASEAQAVCKSGIAVRNDPFA